MIHPKAHVDDSVTLGAGTKVWQFASITRGAVLGQDCSVSPFAMLDGSIYGDRVIVSGGVMAGAGFKVGNNVFLGPNVVLCNDCWPFATKDGYRDDLLRDGRHFSVVIEDGAAIGAGAIILPGVRIGRGAVVAAGAVVERDVPDDHQTQRLSRNAHSGRLAGTTYEMGGMTLHVCTLLWQPNKSSRDFSRCYDESWVERLYRGFRRNLSVPFRFICYVDRSYRFDEPGIEQARILDAEPGYATCIQPYRIGEPMILVGLDTIVVGNIDHLADYCLSENRFALPRDPYHPNIACNGVALVPAGHQLIGTAHEGENDMEWVRRFPHRCIDKLFPGHVVSYKGSVEKHGLGDARIVYFHGQKKPHQLPHVQWIQEHWI